MPAWFLSNLVSVKRSQHSSDADVKPIRLKGDAAGTYAPVDRPVTNRSKLWVILADTAELFPGVSRCETNTLA
jgi:hypothetical protein